MKTHKTPPQKHNENNQRQSTNRTKSGRLEIMEAKNLPRQSTE